MMVCTYDNPNTMMRERWQDGKLQTAYAANLYALKIWPVPPRTYHIGANISDWKPDQIWVINAHFSTPSGTQNDRPRTRSSLQAALNI